jgi:pyrroline-5-carboxylate reductase
MTSKTNSPSESLRDITGTIVLVGAGNMGGAMLEGWLAFGLAPERAVILDPKPSEALIARIGPAVRCNPPLESLTDVAALVVAVKPQVAPNAVPGLAPLIRPDTLAISIMAGKTIAFLEGHLPGAAVVRAIPNTPAAIGRGITVAVPNARVTPQQRMLTTRLLAACGQVEWVDDEALIDLVTAVSGSGPAYVFLMAESLARAGVAAGLPADLAARLARATVAGAGELLHRSDLEASKLRQNVTSPAGTTAAALEVLMADDGLDPLLAKAVAAAARRTRELAG